MKFLPSNLLNKEYKIVEKKKIFMIVSAALVALALIMGIIFAAVGQGFFRFGIDYKGGYVMSIRMGNKLNSQNYSTYYEKLKSIVENVKDDNNQNYGVEILQNKLEGEDDKAAIVIMYQAVVIKTADDEKVASIEYMQKVNEDIEKAIFDSDMFDSVDKYGVQINPDIIITPPISKNLIASVLVAAAIIIILTLVYIGIRFDLVSGIVMALTVLHDIILLCALLIICRIEVNNAFITAVAVTMALSAVNSVMLFGKLKELIKGKNIKELKLDSVANEAIKANTTRTIYTFGAIFVVLLLVCIVCAIAGIASVALFALPLIVALVISFYSTVFIAPALWSLLFAQGLKRTAKPKKAK